MDLTVRPARVSHIPGMCNLLRELFTIESDFFPDREKQSRGLELLVSDKSGLSVVMVAEKDGEVIGMCSVQALVSTAEGGHVGLIEDMVVKKSYRGNGIGKRLLSEIMGWCKNKNLSRVQLLRDMDNFGALKFYILNGWDDTKLTCMRRYL